MLYRCCLSIVTFIIKQDRIAPRTKNFEKNNVIKTRQKVKLKELNTNNINFKINISIHLMAEHTQNNGKQIKDPDIICYVSMVLVCPI